MAAADVMVHRKMVDSMQVDQPSTTDTTDESEEDLYTRLKTLQRQQEFLDIQVLCWVSCSRLSSRAALTNMALFVLNSLLTS